MAQLVRASSQYTRVVGSISGRGTYKNQPMNAEVGGTTDQCLSKKQRKTLACKLFQLMKMPPLSLLQRYFIQSGTWSVASSVSIYYCCMIVTSTRSHIVFDVCWINSICSALSQGWLALTWGAGAPLSHPCSLPSCSGSCFLAFEQCSVGHSRAYTWVNKRWSWIPAVTKLKQLVTGRLWEGGSNSLFPNPWEFQCVSEMP